MSTVCAAIRDFKRKASLPQYAHYTPEMKRHLFWDCMRQAAASHRYNGKRQSTAALVP